MKAVGRLGLSSLTTVLLLAVGSLAQAQPTNPDSVAVSADHIGGFVAEASQRFGIPPSLIRAVMRTESADDARALSPKGAMGLMQIMPDTWSELRARYSLGADPYDPHDNIIAGAAYLREMHDRFGERGFLAAYNAGPSRYEDHLMTGRSLPPETLSYMTAVASLSGVRFGDRDDVASGQASSSLFVSRIGPGSALSRPVSDASVPQVLVSRTANQPPLAPLSDGLFAKLSGRNGRP